MKDDIYLLSVEEYKKYQPHIPPVNCWWWLQSFGVYSDITICVFNDGSICDGGYYVNNNDGAVRPAISLITNGLAIGQRVIRHNFPWIVIGNDIAIAEVPVAFRRFDADSNNYENSEVRKFLLEWIKER